MQKDLNSDQLARNLKQFTGSARYTRLTKSVVLTDGALYLAEQARCYWLFEWFASYLATINEDVEEFTCLSLSKIDASAHIVIDDGNGRGLAAQHVEYTDFPLATITLYACWNGDYWVAMLPGEY